MLPEYELDKNIKVFSRLPVVQAEVYNSPEFEEGRNVFCAFNEEGALAGYAAIYPVLAENGSGYPNVLWAEMKVDPDFQSKGQLRDLLYDKMMVRAAEIRTVHRLKTQKSASAILQPKQRALIISFQRNSRPVMAFTVW